MITGIASVNRARAAGQTQAAPAGKSSGFSEMLRSAVRASGQKGAGLDDVFEEASERYGVPVNLLKAVAKAESGFQADAVSSCGAQGIMQLMPSTAASLGVTEPFNPEQNIMGGAKYLGQLLSSFGGNEKLAVAAYNAGSGAVREYGGVPPYAETQNYVREVLGYAGMDLSAPETAYASGNSAGAETADPAENVLQPGDVLSGTDDYRLAVQAYVQRLEEAVLEDTAGSAAQKNGKQAG